MPFHFSNTVREAQWRHFRNWILRERSAVRPRLLVIEAELRRIGAISVFYEQRTQQVQTPDGAVREQEITTERRLGYAVTSGSSIEKLLWSYIAQGGNPGDVSLFLVPDDVQFVMDPPEDSKTNPDESFTDLGAPSSPPDQPYYGVVSTQSTDAYGPGGRYRGGMPTFVRYAHTLAGRNVDQSDAGSSIAIRMAAMRRWTEQSIKELDRIEHNIRKMMDLREQLQQERETILVQALGGSVPDIPLPDPTRYARSVHVSKLVAEMDAVFYETTQEGGPDFQTIRLGTKDRPDGISNFDTLFDNPEGSDPNTSL